LFNLQPAKVNGQRID